MYVIQTQTHDTSCQRKHTIGTQEGEVHQSWGLEKGSWRREYLGGLRQYWNSESNVKTWMTRDTTKNWYPDKGLRLKRHQGFGPGPAGPLPTRIARGRPRPSPAFGPHWHETHQSCPEPPKLHASLPNSLLTSHRTFNILVQQLTLRVTPSTPTGSSGSSGEERSQSKFFPQAVVPPTGLSPTHRAESHPQSSGLTTRSPARQTYFRSQAGSHPRNVAPPTGLTL